MSGLGWSRGLGSVAAMEEEGRGGGGLLPRLPGVWSAAAGCRGGGLEWRRARRGCGRCAMVVVGVGRCRLLDDDWPLEPRDMGADDTAASSWKGIQMVDGGRGYVSPCCPCPCP